MKKRSDACHVTPVIDVLYKVSLAERAAGPSDVCSLLPFPANSTPPPWDWNPAEAVLQHQRQYTWAFPHTSLCHRL